MGMVEFCRRTLPGLAVLVLCASAPARAESLDQLYQKARAEQSLSLYGGGPAAGYERWTKEFEQRFPGIKVAITGGFSNEVNARIDEQIRSKKLEADIAILQTVQDFVRWKKQGALLRFKPEGFAMVDASFKDSEGAFVSVGVQAIPYAYNTELLAPAEVPQAAPDFLKSRFRGKLVATYPHDNDVSLYAFYLIVRKYGWSYMDKFMANEPRFIQGHLGVVRAIAAGEDLATFDGSMDAQLDLAKAGRPMGVRFSEVDPTPIWPLTAAIFKDAPHVNAAKLYLTWYMAKEQQSRIGTFSSRSDVPPPAGLKPIFSYLVANKYRAFITDTRLIDALRQRFEAYTGPVVNKGGIR